MDQTRVRVENGGRRYLSEVMVNGIEAEELLTTAGCKWIGREGTLVPRQLIKNLGAGMGTQRLIYRSFLGNLALCRGKQRFT
jgi:hypothetical protein